MRRLFVFSRKPSDDVLKNHKFLNYWLDYTRVLCTEDYDDIYTTNMYALSGAQDRFDEIYLDYVQLWPNEKAKFTKKELRFGHDLCRILGAQSKYCYSDNYWDDIINYYGKESDFIKKSNHKNDINEMTVFQLYKKLESFIEQGHDNAKVIANCYFGEYGTCHLRKLSDSCYKNGEINLKFSN